MLVTHVNVSKTKVALYISISIAIIAFTTLTQFSINTVNRVIIQGKFTANLQLKTTLVSPTGTRNTLETSITAPKQNKPIRIGSGKFNFSSQELTLEFTDLNFNNQEAYAEPIYLNIYYIEILLPFAQKIQISQKHLRSYFVSDEYLEDGSSILKIDRNNGKATLKLINPISEHAITISALLQFLALASLIGFSIYLLIRQTNWHDFPAFRDLNLGKHISSKSEFNAINGLRGLAAILVVFSHTAPGFYGINVGISMLFILSGFLLSKPFILNPVKIYSWKEVEEYIVKRLRRILPMYYLFIFVTYVFVMDFETALRHFLFIEAANHLWPMTQIFTFYMLLPIVLLITSGLHKLNKWLPVIGLIASILFYINVADNWEPYYNGRHHRQFYLYAFLMGVLGSYLHYGFIRNFEPIKMFISKYINSFGLISAGLTLLTIIWSAPITPPDAFLWYFSSFQFKGVLTTAIIVITLNVERSWFMPIISNWLFRSIGVVGFSFYLLHALGMQIVLEFQRHFMGIIEPMERSWVFALSVLAVTYVMALISYSYVERPFFGYKRKD